MPNRATTYKRALATFETTDAQVRRLVDAIKAEAGERADVLSDWPNVVPELNGKAFGCAAWLWQCQHVNVSALPHAAELAWLRLTPQERSGVLPLPAAATRKSTGPAP